MTLDATYNTDFAQVEVDTATNQLRSLQPLLSREAAVLPGECGALLGRDHRRGRSVLQPRDRDWRRQQSDPDHGRRPSDRPGHGQHEHRRHEHADRRRRIARDQGQQLQRGARPEGAAEPLRRGCHVRQPAGDRRSRERTGLQPELRGRRTARVWPERSRQRIYRAHSDA